jgi:hypothetical protein
LATGIGWGESSDPAFFFDGGTSMATPLVAGCAAVVREYLQSKGLANPSAALVKAMLINGADIITGQYAPPEVAPPPDNSQGFGRVNLIATVAPDPSQNVSFSDEGPALDTGDTKTIFSVPAATLVKATLVWTDLPGEALQNDLDLIVRTGGGQEFHGNMPAVSTEFDRTNNVEQVLIQLGAPDSITVSVSCHQALAPQGFALVVRTKP